MAFGTSRCDFALLSSVILLSPEIAHRSMLLVLLSACIHSFEIKINLVIILLKSQTLEGQVGFPPNK